MSISLDSINIESTSLGLKLLEWIILSTGDCLCLFNQESKIQYECLFFSLSLNFYAINPRIVDRVYIRFLLNKRT